MRREAKTYQWDKSIKWISGYEGSYAVTTDGCVATYRCTKKSRYKPIWLKQTWCGNPKRPNNQRLAVHLWKNNRFSSVFVHLIILETFVGPRPPGKEACHINSDRSCNHIYNLRWDTPRSNRLDRSKVGCSSKYWGVSWSKIEKKWRAEISVKGKKKFLGYFPGTPEGEIEAAKAYNAAALQLIGPNARINTIP